MIRPVPLVPGVFHFNLGVVNAYAIETARGTVLVDTGPTMSAGLLAQAVEQLGGAPRAIVLTHGHLDHAGGARSLARRWGVPIFAHEREIEFLRGARAYPPPDPTQGAIGDVSRLLPWPQLDLGPHLRPLPPGERWEMLPDWRVIETPGHTPGHICLFDARHKTLLAGDALCTLDPDSWLGLLARFPVLTRPAAAFTSDWPAATRSLEVLAELEPTLIAAGHGTPLGGIDAPAALTSLAHARPVPTAGRYAHAAPMMSEGEWVLPPAPADPLPARAAIAASLVVLALALRRGKRRPPSGQ